MTSSTNPYEQARAETLAPYEAFVNNSCPGIFAVIATFPETSAAPTLRTALVASAERFGFSSDDITWIWREAATKLEDKELVALIEALDPLVLIICDQASVEACSRAYRTHLPLNCASSLLIRPCACFTDLTGLLETPKGKQHAWHTLKETLSAL